MKYFVFLALCTLMLLNCDRSNNSLQCDYDKVGYEKYCELLDQTGKVKMRFGVNGDDSLVKWYYPNGDINFSGNFYRGNPHGWHFYYDEDSIISYEKLYNYDYETGQFIIASEIKYTEGEIDPKLSWYHILTVEDTVNSTDSIFLKLEYFSPVLLDSLDMYIGIEKLKKPRKTMEKRNLNNKTYFEYINPPLMDTGNYAVLGFIDNYKIREDSGGVLKRDILKKRMKIWDIIYVK